jgi:hypothetical protein
MIQDIFVSTLSNQIIFGNGSKYPEVSKYPIENIGDKTICQLKVNDIILSIVFSHIHSFCASKFLLDLSVLIKSKINILNSESVSKYYFILLELSQNPEIVFETPTPKQIQSGINLDIVEDVYTVISKNGIVLKTKISGNILINYKNFQESLLKDNMLKVRLNIDDIISYNSPYECIEDLCSVEVVNSVINHPSLISYSSFFKHTLFRLKKVNSSYTFFSDCNLKFSFIKIMIPVN